MGAKSREAYKSPIDGTIITGERSEKYHMDKHNVVRPGDFGENEGRQYFDNARKDRQDFFDGSNQGHHREVKKDIEKSIDMLNKGHKPKKPETTDE